MGGGGKTINSSLARRVLGDYKFWHKKVINNTTAKWISSDAIPNLVSKNQPGRELSHNLVAPETV